MRRAVQNFTNDSAGQVSSVAAMSSMYSAVGANFKRIFRGTLYTSFKLGTINELQKMSKYGIITNDVRVYLFILLLIDPLSCAQERGEPGCA
jgi:hypothetical protein